MRNFYTDDFSISKINFCMFVPKGSGQRVHKNRPSHGLVMQMSGSKRYIFEDGHEMTAAAGSVFYLPKFSSYEAIDIEPGDCIAVNFDLADARTTYDSFIHMPPQGSKFEKIFMRISERWTQKKNGYMNGCLADLYAIIYNIQQLGEQAYLSKRSRDLVSDALEFILKNITSSELTVDAIAKSLEITPEYLRKLFKTSCGISPRAYIIEQRMGKARELILSGEFSISAVCRMCGYDSESYFSSEFKRFYGVSPSECANSFAGSIKPTLSE